MEDAPIEDGSRRAHQPSMFADLASEQKPCHQITNSFNQTEGSPGEALSDEPFPGIEMGELRCLKWRFAVGVLMPCVTLRLVQYVVLVYSESKGQIALSFMDLYLLDHAGLMFGVGLHHLHSNRWLGKFGCPVVGRFWLAVGELMRFCLADDGVLISCGMSMPGPPILYTADVWDLLAVSFRPCLVLAVCYRC
ncbi:hypothetical protein Nepgr_027271 [Nepenthes gracilis]|uniref:Uncharacterized protein n=1 Tax=Nepenthes gracilis TaxID=150966 RepID=A0AAD3T8M0_NEPGR|nr:hypothetical protein Nepgr_027271 [Nepenthes gracilis]